MDKLNKSVTVHLLRDVSHKNVAKIIYFEDSSEVCFMKMACVYFYYSAYTTILS